MRTKCLAIWFFLNISLLVMPPVMLYRSHIDANYWRAEAAGDTHDLSPADTIYIAVVFGFFILIALFVVNGIAFWAWKIYKRAQRN